MSGDTWLRKASRSALGPLVNALPDQAMAMHLHFALGIVAAVCFAVGDPSVRSGGAALYVVAMALERAIPDSVTETARRASMIHMLSFVGLGFGLRYSGLGSEAILMGIVAGFAVGALLLIERRLDALIVEKHGQERGQRHWRGASVAGIETADLLLIVPIMIWADRAEAMLAYATFVVPALTVGLTVAYVIRRKRDGR